MSMDLFRGPIPGQSLTKPMGSLQCENPPQYADLNDALEHMFQALTQDRQVTRLVLMLKKGIPVEYIAKTIIFTGFGKGMWTPTVGLMMLKTVMAMIMSIAHIKKVKHVIFNPDKDQNDFLDKFMDMIQNPEEDKDEAAPEPSGGQPQFKGLLGGSL